MIVVGVQHKATSQNLLHTTLWHAIHVPLVDFVELLLAWQQCRMPQVCKVLLNGITSLITTAAKSSLSWLQSNWANIQPANQIT